MIETAEIIEVVTPDQYAAAAALFRQYQQYLGVDLCFQSFEDELANLPAMYGAPQGCILLAQERGVYVGCVALRPAKGQPGVCEMKRLYVLPEHMGKGYGRALAAGIVQRAQGAGYQAMVLDTLDRLKPAIQLYRSLGFEEMEPYYANPLEGVVYMRKAFGFLNH